MNENELKLKLIDELNNKSEFYSKFSKLREEWMQKIEKLEMENEKLREELIRIKKDKK